MGARRAGRRRSRADPHREASRRLLSLADAHDRALGRGESVARRAGRRRARVRRRVSRRGTAGRAVSLAVGSQQSARTAIRRGTTISTAISSPSCSRATATIAEVWFDGANGEGPNGKRQVYDWPRVFALVRRLQPNAVMFSDAGPDVRWCGNENGVAGDPNWSTVDPARRAVSRRERPGDRRRVAARRSRRHGVASRGSRRVDSARMVLSPGRGRARSSVDNLVDSVFHLGRSEREAAAQRSADARRAAARRPTSRGSRNFASD